MDSTSVLRDRGVGVGKKLVGDAVAGDVRQGKTFSNANGNNNTGTIPVRDSGGPVVITPGAANKTQAAGIYDNTITVNGDPDLVPGNIRAQVSIFGVVGKTEVIDTTEATAPAAAGNILSGKIGYINGAKITGTMPNNGAVTINPGTADQTIPAGYHSGAGKVPGDPDLVPGNIRAGANVFGVTGKNEVVDTTEAMAPAAAGNVLSGKIAYVNGVKVTGSMPNNGGLNFVPGTVDQTLPAGYTSGGTIYGDPDLASGNIRAGVNVFGVVGKTEVVDTTEAAAPTAAGNILSGKVGYVNGTKIVGSMPNNGTLGTYTPGTANQTIPAGYTSGGTVAGDADLVTGNIRAGANIFGVAGKASVVETSDAGKDAPSGEETGTYSFNNNNFIQVSLSYQPVSVSVTQGSYSLTYDSATPDKYIIDGQTKYFANEGGYVNNTGFKFWINNWDLASTAAWTATGGSTAFTLTTADKLLSSWIAYVDGSKLTGTMPDNGYLGTITPGVSDIEIPSGYTIGGTILGDPDLIPANILSGKSIFNVSGSYDPFTTTAGGSLTLLQYALNKNILNGYYDTYQINVSLVGDVQVSIVGHTSNSSFGTYVKLDKIDGQGNRSTLGEYRWTSTSDQTVTWNAFGLKKGDKLIISQKGTSSYYSWISTITVGIYDNLVSGSKL